MPDPTDAVAKATTEKLLAANSIEVFNAYLPQLSELYAPLEKDDFDSEYNVRYFDISKWVTDKKENSLEKLVNVYAVLSYDRQLTTEEVHNYELTPVTYRVGFTKKELTFLTMCLEASVMKSKIGEAGLLGDLWMKLDKALENGGEYDED